MWWVWLLVGLAAAMVEIGASGLIFAGIAVAAIAALIVSLFTSGILPAAIVFVVATLFYLILLRPLALRRFESPSLHLLTAGPKALAGRQALVTQDISAVGGQIRVGQGEFWSARPFDEKELIPIGTTVEIVSVDGLTAKVWPVKE